jgi:hypothetical protein
MQVAYLDAGTGSMLVSAIVAGAAGVGVILRLSWRRIVASLSLKQRSEQRAAVGTEAAAHDRAVSPGTGTAAEPRT